jgi:peptidyl-prolyl cis-trans isomerase B (cyclophilin B)
MRFLTSLIFCLVLTCGNASGQTEKGSAAKTQTEPVKKANQRSSDPAKTAKAEPFDKATVEVMKNQCVSLETEAGIIELELFPESAPQTVRNFLNLAAIGALDTTSFSRVVPGFVVQGGNLSTREKITPEIALRSRRTIPDEPNQIRHERGILSMARPQEPNGASSHFFILLGESSNLDGKFAAFGRVTKGMDVVEAINKMPVEGEKPLKPVRIKHAKVAVCPPPAPTAGQ